MTSIDHHELCYEKCVVLFREIQKDSLAVRLLQSQDSSCAIKPSQGMDHLGTREVEKEMTKLGRCVTSRKGRIE